MKKNLTIFISGHFNVLHAGHLRLFKKAKEIAEFLIVGVESNRIAGSSAHIDEKLRLEAIKNIAIIDESFLIKKDIKKIIEELKPDFILKGKEFETKENPEETVLNKYGGKLIFNSGDISFSSLDLLKKEINNEQNIPKIPQNFLKTHAITQKKIHSILKKFRNKKVAIFGDLIIDEYINCDALGMSQEEPSIVLKPVDEKKYIGGAGIVALHAKKLGAQVDFYSVVGEKDINSEYAINELKKQDINNYLFKDISRPTTIKTRFRCNGKSLLRINRLEEHWISQKITKLIITKLKKNINNYDLVVFSDFSYGLLSPHLIEEIIMMCEKNNIMMIADSQSSSQLGDISKFKNMKLVTPTEFEARLATRNSQDGLVILINELKKINYAENIILTLGKNGVIIQTGEIGTDSFYTDSLPAFNQNPEDVSGAGDSLLITAGLSLACGATIWEASLIGSIAASIQVSRQGNHPLDLKKIIEKIQL